MPNLVCYVHVHCWQRRAWKRFWGDQQFYFVYMIFSPLLDHASVCAYVKVSYACQVWYRKQQQRLSNLQEKLKLH